jgi:transposase-like protein
MWVFEGIERDSSKCFLVPVPDRKKETLIALIKEWIEPGTIIYSDCWGPYKDIM